MKKGLIAIIVIVVLALILIAPAISFKNEAVVLEQDVQEAWGNVETSYQRRNDLIGNLVNTVQGAADFERNTLREVIEARSKATQTTIDPTNVTPDQVEAFNEAQGQLSGALSRLLVTVERYPDLKSNQNFLKLQDELTSTENTIQTARVRYNEAIKPFNNHVETFPNSLYAGFFGYDEMPFFRGKAGSEEPVEVDFDFDS